MKGTDHFRKNGKIMFIITNQEVEYEGVDWIKPVPGMVLQAQ
jgi:hypothetical protein